MEVLFVCEMNFERSPAAEYIAKAEAEQRGLLTIQFSSAGLEDPHYGFMSVPMRRSLYELGYPDPISHKPRKVTPEILSRQDLILCFTNHHVELINNIIGGQDPRVHTLTDFTGEKGDIPAPQAFMKDNVLSTAAMYLPPAWKRNLSAILGYVHRGDTEGVALIHDKVTRQIEGYVLRALDRIATQAQFRLDSPNV